jgi:hypothetical protein
MTSPFSNNLITDPVHPFKNDYTGNLEKISQGLTKLFEIEAKGKSLTVTVDAPWGVGKTSFVDMWGQSLLNQKKIAIKFDAWKADYSDFPLLAIISQLTNQFRKQNLESGLIEDFVDSGKKLCSALLPGLIKFGANWALGAIRAEQAMKDLMNDLTESLSDNIDQQISDQIEKYDETIITMESFKNKLKAIAKDEIIFLFTDELDRCKPSFAINTLEVLKHIFNVDNLCCIVSTNVKSLSQVISKNYGYDPESAMDYLERFFDIPVKLPAHDKEKYLDHKIKNIDIICDAVKNSHFFMEVMKICCSSGNFSLRVIDKYVRDMRIFLECNRMEDENTKTPHQYYPSIAVRVSLKRVHGSMQYNEIIGDLNKSIYFKWADEFFEGSKSEMMLSSIAEKFLSEMQSLQHKQMDQKERIKHFDDFQKVHNTIFHDLYGCTKPVRAAYTDDGVVYREHVNNYLNHYENANKILSFLDLFPKSIREPEENIGLLTNTM